MRIEIPEFKRCCCCLPLRYGLLVWSYLLLISSIHSAVQYIMFVVFYIKYELRSWIIILYSVGFIILSVKTSLTFLFIVAAHKKSVRLLRLYYKISLFTIIASFVFEALSLVRSIAYYWDKPFPLTSCKYLMLTLVFNIICFGVQLYVLWLVRSEILKLEKNYNFRFSNIAAEAENEYYEPNSMIDLGKATETNESMVDAHGNE